jgi:hypothetical protein
MQPQPADLRQSLRDAGLPAQMIPSRIVFLEALPRTTSGKLNRRALTEAGIAQIDQNREHTSVVPRNLREEAMAAVWMRVLGVSNLGIHDNFFDLGGHSLTAARVAAQASRDLAATISVRDVFTYPTIAELTSFIDALAWIGSPQSTDKRDDDYEDVTL